MIRMPDELFPDLFVEVQSKRIFPDSKTFVDACAKVDVTTINSKFMEERQTSDFDLKSFVVKYFELPEQKDSAFKSNVSDTPVQHIEKLWEILKREAELQQPGSSLIALPNPYIVPGGRFGEIYYWDSYFTMLGLKVSGRTDLIRDMVQNFSFLIKTVGHIPNGNRSYFISRSQPPFFSLMIDLLAELEGDYIYPQYLSSLQSEYNFWMSGLSILKEGIPTRRLVNVHGHILNRYWDDHPIPRQESYLEDVETASELDSESKINLYRNIRAACESGWDFSTRWLADKKNLSTICTTEIIPVDLNVLLYNLESTLSISYAKQDNQQLSIQYSELAAKRRIAIDAILWDEKSGIYQDYNFCRSAFTGVPSMAMAFPLFVGISNSKNSARVIAYLKGHLLKAGGLSCTEINSGQQWDAPNGWAPLQWVGLKAFINYGYNALARDLIQRWLSNNDRIFAQSRKFVEKYDVENPKGAAGGGEYPLQDGFGWTNGVYLAMKSIQNQL